MRIICLSCEPDNEKSGLKNDILAARKSHFGNDDAGQNKMCSSTQTDTLYIETESGVQLFYSTIINKCAESCSLWTWVLAADKQSSFDHVT